jgi:hypothetical protein
MGSTTWKFTQNDLITTGKCTSYGEQDHSLTTAEFFEKVMPLCGRLTALEHGLQ